jgi:hypothetical protein
MKVNVSASGTAHDHVRTVTAKGTGAGLRCFHAHPGVQSGALRVQHKESRGPHSEPERLRQYLAGIARTWTFEQEFLTLLRKSKMDFDPRYVFDGVPCPGHSES